MTTRAQFAGHVWDYDFVAMSDVVDVYVGYLRRKLGDDHEPRLLHTVRGTGYQLKRSMTTRAQFAEHVWDYDFVAMSDVVDGYVGYLRRKLGDDHEPRLLHTVRGTGYQFKRP
jgi:DNA-binding response OmpR family regulator